MKVAFLRSMKMRVVLSVLSLTVLAASVPGAVVVNITTHSDGDTLQDVVAVNAIAYDSNVGTGDGAGIHDVLFELLDGSERVLGHIELGASYDWSLDVAGILSGEYTLKVTANASAGGSDSTKITVHTIANPRPASSWTLTFSDEFNGTGAPDSLKWDRPEYLRRNNPGGPDGWWEQDDSYMESGNLVIRNRRVADINGDGDPYDYTSGAVRTLGHFTQTYGKYEIQCQLPGEQGWWVAFWMMQGNQGSVGNGGVDGSEVDIMEAWGWTDRINHAFHWDGYGADHQSIGSSSLPTGIRTGFHTYTLIWDPDMYYFYIDSVEVWRSIGGGVCNQPGYIKITGECSTEDWAIDDSWSGNPDIATYPDYFLVDWVRVYKDGESPVVSITSPADRDTFDVNGDITITADASDIDGSVTGVDFYQGSTLLGTDMSSPYSFTWESVPEANYTLTAIATDNDGRIGASSPVNITVGNPPPFPINLQGAPPEEKTVIWYISKPDSVLYAKLEMTVLDPDNTFEGVLEINGSTNSITLFGDQGVSTNDGQIATVSYDMPASWWNDGANTLRFTHEATGGYRIDDATVTFSDDSPVHVKVLRQSDGFSLSQSYPNPFTTETYINYELPETSNVQLEVYDLTGSRIKALVNIEQQSGFYSVRWDGLNETGRHVANGIYFYRLKATGASQCINGTGRIILLK